MKSLVGNHEDVISKSFLSYWAELGVIMMKRCKRKMVATEINRVVLAYYEIENIEVDCLDMQTISFIKKTMEHRVLAKYPQASQEDIEDYIVCVMTNVMCLDKIIVAEFTSKAVNRELEELIERCRTMKQELRRVCKEQKVSSSGVDEAIAKFILVQMEWFLAGDLVPYCIPRQEYGLLYTQFIPIDKWLLFATECETEEDYETLEDLLEILPLTADDAEVVEAILVQLKLRGIGNGY